MIRDWKFIVVLCLVVLALFLVLFASINKDEFRLSKPQDVTKISFIETIPNRLEFVCTEIFSVGKAIIIRDNLYSNQLPID